MQLKLQRSQRSSGVFSKSVVFCLDVRAELTPEETQNVQKYKLGSMAIYNSEASKRHLAVGKEAIASGGLGQAFLKLAMAKLSLNITIDSLCGGHHIECKDLDELLGGRASRHGGVQDPQDVS